MNTHDFAVLAGTVATTLFMGSYLPMLWKAYRTRDLASYSRSSLVIANVGNVAQGVYVVSLPVGPIWLLHGFYVLATGFMTALHIRHVPRRSVEDELDADDAEPGRRELVGAGGGVR